jgi:PAS domain S-box-containing protein
MIGMADRLDVLLIEDNREGAEYIGRLLQSEHQAVVLQWASKLQTGLKRLADGGLDAALINLNHPESHGLTTLALVRETNQHVPIVVLISLDDIETAAEAIRHGAQDFLIKEHLTADRLERAIRHAISRQQTSESLHESQEAVHRSEARLRATLDAALDCIVTVDADGNILDFNPAAQQAFGYERDEVIGENMGDLLFPKETRDRQRRNFEKYKKKKGEGSMLGKRIETPALRKDGTQFIAEMATQPVPYHDTLAFTVFLRDITKRKRAEQQRKQYAEELERSNRDLDQYASIVSHDLTAPLRGITGFCDLLQRESEEVLSEKAGEYMSFIVGSARRMKTLIEDLRSYSRVATEAKPSERLDCQAVLRRALDNLEVEILESGAQITNDPLPVLMADRTQMTQLFQNLVGNAIKYRGEDPPKIHVSAKNLGDAWQICICDNGIGISSDETERIFEIFHRLHGDEAEYPGTGIGLAVCKRIVHRHGGRIWVESEPSKGSSFYFTIPVNPAHQD